MLSRFTSMVSVQRGQALPVGLALILFGSLLAVVLFNSGQMTSEKSRLANTADAAVYSGLVWQARALNFQAYTNRAMVANQVSIAQFVSLNSWTKYGHQTTDNINNTLGWFPPFRPFTQAAESVMNAVDMVVNVVATVAVPVIDGVNMVLSETQRAVYISTFAITPTLVRDVVKANDGHYDVGSVYGIASLGLNALDWNSFAKRYDDEQGLKRKADLITRSRDKFTQKRNWSLGTLWVAPTSKFKLKKEGATHLVYDGDKWAWKGKDTLSLHWKNYRCSWKGCKWKRREVPIGWGAAYASENIGCGNSCPAWVYSNRRAQSLADRWDPEEIAGYNGVRAYYDLTDLSANNKDPRLQLRVEVQVSEGQVKTSTKIAGLGSSSAPTNATTKNGVGEGMYWTGDETAANKMASLSSGEIYFERPSELRVGGQVKKEYGNLYNPYWQVRLIDTSSEQRLAAWVLRSPGLVSSSVSGVSSALTQYASQQMGELQSLQELQTYAQQETSQLTGYVEQQVLLDSQLNGVQSQVSSVEDVIQQAKQSGMSPTDPFLQQKNAELQQLKNLESNTQTKLQGVIAKVEQATQLQSQLGSIQGQITEVTNQISSPNFSVGQGFTQDINQASSVAAQIASGGLSNIQNQLVDSGKEALESAVEDALMGQVEEILEDAVSAVINQYGGNVIGLSNSAKNVANEAQSMNEDYIQPLQDQVEAMEAQIAQVASEVEAEIQVGVSQFEGAIDSVKSEMTLRVNELEGQLQQEVNLAENALNNITTQIADKITEQSKTIIPAEINALQVQIDNLQMQVPTLELSVSQLQTRLSVEPLALQGHYQNQINGLMTEKQALADSVNSKIDEVTATLNSDLIEVKGQLSALL